MAQIASVGVTAGAVGAGGQWLGQRLRDSGTGRPAAGADAAASGAGDGAAGDDGVPRAAVAEVVEPGKVTS